MLNDNNKNEMSLRLKIIEAATSQLGVKYHKDTRCPGVAFDCVQFVGWCYEQALGKPVIFPLQGSCVGFIDDRILRYLEALGARKIPLHKAKEGDIIVWNYKGIPHHTGMIYSTAPLECVHSCATYGKVVAHSLTGEWAVGRRLNSVWSILI